MRIGKSISGLKVSEMVIHSSPMPRCIETSKLISDSSGFDARIDITDVLGLPGTAFIYDTNGSDETNKYPLMENAIRSLEGKDVSGWYSPWVAARSILEFLSDDLKEDGRLTLCVSHDAFVARMSGVLSGQYYGDRWFGFADGVVILRKGDNLYTVVDGRVVRIPDLDKKECRIINRHSQNISRRIAGPEGIVGFVDDDGKYGFYEQHGIPISSDRFSYVGEMKYSRAVVGVEGKGFTFLNDMGEYPIRRWFTQCLPFHKGFAVVKDETGWYHIDTHGRRLYDRHFAVAEPFYNDVSRCIDGCGNTVLVSPDGKMETIIEGESS